MSLGEAPQYSPCVDKPCIIQFLSDLPHQSVHAGRPDEEESLPHGPAHSLGTSTGVRYGQVQTFLARQHSAGVSFLKREKNKELFTLQEARPHSSFGSASDSRARGLRFDTQSGNILLFLLLQIQEGQLSVTGKRMFTKNWLTT